MPRAILCIAALLATVETAAGTQAAPAWHEAPSLAALFAPARERSAAYRAFVSPASLSDAIEQLVRDGSIDRRPGMWTVRPAAPVDAFGSAGRYDRSRVSRLYGAVRPDVARGVRSSADQQLEYWTLVSPYPDPALGRLERGTLLLVIRYDLRNPGLK